MTPRSKCPKLARLAHDCWEVGPVNLGAVVFAFAEALKEELPFTERRTHPCTGMIVGHLAFMACSALGPSEQNVEDYLDWLKKQDVLEKYAIAQPQPAALAEAA